MYKFISEFNIDSNFWELNPHFKYLTEFKELYEKDKSKNKEFSSKQLWAIALYVDINSPFRRMAPEIRKKEILNYLTNKHKWEDLEPYFQKYEQVCLTEKQQLFKSWGDKLRAREKFIRDTEYKASTFKMLDQMMADTKKMWDNYKQVEAEMIEEARQEIIRGGRKKSKSERKEI
ncbi:MAG: hypothetical protein KatS3mg002_1363 [Candidatus Woesearchaeota archaeon]|nr:MAG: hypothetical protein KatS3mg002_1363 [Candidatus Woesearchaeota archaeon]